MRHGVIISDTHCGHRFGITPPKWQDKDRDEERAWAKAGEWQRASWAWLMKKKREIGPIDDLLFNGDATDGKGERSGGNELITTDRLEQAAMAVKVVELFAPKKGTFMTRGTPYHVGMSEEFEDVVAEKVGARIGDHEWYEHAGFIIDMKHFVSNSSIPHGRYTAIARDQVWNILWAERELQPRANFIVRSHVHRLAKIGDATFDAVTTPGLQLWTKFGARACSGTIDVGIIEFTIDDKGRFSWVVHTMDIRFAKSIVRSL